jgi:hypothetical protein
MLNGTNIPQTNLPNADDIEGVGVGSQKGWKQK